MSDRVASLWSNWPPLPRGTQAVLVEAAAEDIEDCPDYGVATVILYPPNADPADANASLRALCCFFSQDNSALDTVEMVACVTEGLNSNKPIFLYFDDMGDAVTCLARLRTLGCTVA